MIRCLIIKAGDYIKIVYLLLSHIMKKRRLELNGLISIVLLMALGVLLPNIISVLYGYQLDFFSASVTYIVMTICGLIIMITANSTITISRMFYECRYNYRLFKFMIECYHSIITEYNSFIKDNQYLNRSYNKISHDLTIVSTIFFKIFSMYFNAMETKNKNSEPYLIDIQEMKTLYVSKEFNDFYSTLFFDDICKESQNPFEKILIYILDEVLTTLYKKPWFVEYYDEKTVFQLVKYILTNWFGNIVQYSIIQRVNKETLI